MPPVESTDSNEAPVNDVRSALEAAVEEYEKTEATPPPEPPAEKPAEPEEKPEESEEKPEETKDEVTSPAPPPEGDAAPKSWKASTRAKWDKLDPEIKAEVRRRESDMTRAFGENAQARELQKQFNEMVRPFEARIRATGYSPVEMVNELFKADYILSTAPMGQRAQYMAKLIKDYSVDIRALDDALAGEPTADPVAARVDQLLQQRLSPIQQFVVQQQQVEQLREQALAKQASDEIEAMSTDPKYPYFEQVREDMADIFDLSSKRGVYLTPAQAYTRAVAMNPELSAQAATQQQAEQRRQQAQKQNGRAQQAMLASSSVPSSPSGTPKPGSSANSSSLRDTIEAAMNDVIGR